MKYKPTPQPPAAAGSSPAETKRRILDAAETLLAQHGVEGVSSREITRAAGVNLAAINYHFGTKQALIEEVFSRRLTPLNQKRLALLNEVERQAQDQSFKLEAVLEAFIRPAVEQGFNCQSGNNSFMRLIGRCLSEPGAQLETLIYTHFAELARRFDIAFRRALPELAPEELVWRLWFIVGALHHSMLIYTNVDSLPGRRPKRLNAEGLVQRLIAFSAAGLTASVSP